MEKRYLECNCELPDHLIKFSWWRQEKDKEFQYLYVAVQTASYMGFFRRIWTAFKFILGINNIHWSETLIFEKEAKELRDIIDEYLVDVKSK